MSNETVGLLTIVAILVGPFAALAVQRCSDDRKEARNRKLWVFKTLIMDRATPISVAYVQALNLIDVEFTDSSENEKAIRTAWKVLRDHLSSDTKAATWAERRIQLNADLLSKMGKCLGYDFDEVYLKNDAYYPEGLGNIEGEQHELRRKLLEMIDGNRRLSVAVFEQRFPDIVDDRVQGANQGND